MKNINTLLLLYILFCQTANAQNSNVRTDSLVKSTIRSSITIPSHKKEPALPQTWLMNMYGDYPVDLSTGLVNISIPLYEIKTTNLTLPINAQFHASGLRSDEQIGTMGLRWIMNIDCMVSRKIKGYPDECFYGSTSSPFDNRVNAPNYIPDLATLYGGTAYRKEWATSYAISNNILPQLSNYTGPASTFMDTEYDLFSYHLPSGKSGKFILKDSAGIKIPCTIPYEPIKIEINRTQIHGNFNQIIITDENGTTYNYGKIITGAVNKENTDSQIINGDNHQIGWHLNAIISANKKDSILIEYQSVNIKTRYWLSTDWIIRDSFIKQIPNYWPPFPDYVSDFFSDEYKENPEQYIAFTYDDPPHPTFNHLSKITFNGGSIKFNYSNMFESYFLSSIEIFDTQNMKTKKIECTYHQNQKLVCLDQLSFIDTNNEINGEKATYQFSYFSPDTHYSTNDIPQSDWWGYYSSGRYGVIPENITIDEPVWPSRPQNVNIGIGTHQDINSNTYSMKVGMIETIVYPTGGKTNFDYESNFYYRTNIGKEACGGLRIKSIENISAKGKSEFKTYKYNPQYNGYGSMPEYFQPPRHNQYKGKNFMTEINVSADQRSTEDYRISLMSLDYKIRTYSNKQPAQFFDFHSTLVYYDEVIEYQGKENNNAGYTKYCYQVQLPQSTEYIYSSDAFKYANRFNSKQFMHVLPPTAETGSKLWKKIAYNSDNQIVKEIIYEYKTFNKGILYDMPIKKFWEYRFGGLEMYFAKDAELISCDLFWQQTYGYLNQKYKLDASRLSKEITNQYTPQGIVSKVKKIEYDPVYLLPIKETVTGRINSDSISYVYKRPYHYTQAPYTEMAAKHILNTVIENKVYKNNNLLETGTTNYKKWFTDIYEPMNYCYQKQGYNQETRLTYEYNRYGQLQAATKDGSQKIVYIYNACSQPLAVIEQANYNEVEALLGNTLIDRVAQSYIINNSDMAKLNQLRQQLPNALVTTYTYKPLIGMATSTDPQGRTTYYIYDGLGRLIETYTKDSNNNLIKDWNKYNYNKFY